MTTEDYITVHLDGDPSIREEGFFEAKSFELTVRNAVLEYDNAELVKSNEGLKERVEKLASRQPQWPKGYRPNRNNHFHKAAHPKKVLNNDR